MDSQMGSSNQCSDERPEEQEEEELKSSSFFIKSAKSLVMKPMFKPQVVKSKKGKGSYKRKKKVDSNDD